MTNKNLRTAHRLKADEFYTTRADIERELECYPNAFAGKKIYCNTDDPETSEFVKYFCENFKSLGIKELTASFKPLPESLKQPCAFRYDGVNATRWALSSGDFKSAECVKLLDACDIVITNPPFSLFRDFIKLLDDHAKQFLIIGNLNAALYSSIFPMFKARRVWFGATKPVQFGVPQDASYLLPEKTIRKLDNGDYIRFGGASRWFTNLRHLTARKVYKLLPQPRMYDNFDALDVPCMKVLPADYRGIMGVPVTFFDHDDGKTFEIIGNSGELRNGGTRIGGRPTYKRVFIRRVDVR